MGLLLWFSHGDPNLNARIIINAVFNAIWMLWLARVLLTRRPAFFGSADRLQATLWLVLTVADLGRALYAGFFMPPLTDFLVGPAYQNQWILLVILTSLLVALSQVVMNAQRLEYDLRQARAALEEDIRERERIQDALRLAKARLEATVNALPDLLLRVDRAGRARECHTADPNRLILPPAQFFGRPVTEVLPPEAARWYSTPWGRRSAKANTGEPAMS